VVDKDCDFFGALGAQLHRDRVTLWSYDETRMVSSRSCAD